MDRLADIRCGGGGSGRRRVGERARAEESTKYLSPSKDEKPTAATDWVLIDFREKDILPVDVMVPPVSELVAHHLVATNNPVEVRCEDRDATDTTARGPDDINTNTQTAIPIALPRCAPITPLASILGYKPRARLRLLSSSALNDLSDQFPRLFNDKAHRNTGTRIEYDNSAYASNYDKVLTKHNSISWRRRYDGKNLESDLLVTTEYSIERAIAVEKNDPHALSRHRQILESTLTTKPTAFKAELLPLQNHSDAQLKTCAQDYLRQIEEHQAMQLLPSGDLTASATTRPAHSTI
jgi:hypothetical protein